MLKTATADEIPQILALIHEGIEFWAGDDYPKLRQWYDETYTYEYVLNRVNHGFTIVAHKEDNPGIIAGTINLNHVSDEEGYLGSLYCKIKGQGLGTQLLEHALHFAETQGHELVSCNIFEHNTISRNLMVKHGAKFTKRETWGGYNYDTYQFNLSEM